MRWKTPDAILGIDTSNYKTSAALYFPETGEWQSRGALLSVSAGACGLRQSDALFMHVKALPGIIAQLDLHGGRIAAVACSERPRSVEGSYMPCFLAGMSVAQSLASIMGVKYYAFSHQQGHIASALFSACRMELMRGELWAWHLSGGTTELLKVVPDGALFSASIAGGTDDISAGQLIDRTGVLLGMPFPAGPYVEQAALRSASRDFYRVKVKDRRFSLSGIENKIKKMAQNGVYAEDICAYSLNTVAYAVQEATKQALSEKNMPVAVSGGVSACSIVKNALSDIGEVYFAEKGLGGDNALGAGLLCAKTERKI